MYTVHSAPDSVECRLCGGTANRVNARAYNGFAHYNCERCRTGGHIRPDGDRIGPVFEPTTEAARTIHRRRARA